MPDQTIKCPHCSREIPLTETLSSQIKEGVRKEFEDKARARELELKKREDALVGRAREVEEEKRSLEESIAKRLAVQKAKLVEGAERKAKEDFVVELKNLKDENDEKARLLAEARGKELELRKQARELEEAKKTVELDVARRIDAEREKIRLSTIEMFSEEHRLRDFEKEKKIADMQKMIDELKRKSEQGSQQAQGEALELDLESLLKSRFPVDSIEPVPKGMRGADILQKVYTRTGVYCGSIAWESKRTKAWNDEWISKLKEDQLEVRAETAVIVTETLPKGVASFSQMDGVWVTAIPLAGALAEALRVSLIQVALSRLSAEGKNEKMESIYYYLTGTEFRQKVEAIVEAFKAMQEDLDAEKRLMNKNWAKREKQIEKVMMNTLRMYGDVQGISGKSLPELKSLDSGNDNEDAVEGA
ncbi:MAG: DUF2130 domain-containing protein [Deltaproteobacteria bacterium]|nr:DUF2130 domain-containing protein [Deltaproteobacteria bacterium]